MTGIVIDATLLHTPYNPHLYSIAAPTPRQVQCLSCCLLLLSLSEEGQVIQGSFADERCRQALDFYPILNQVFTPAPHIEAEGVWFTLRGAFKSISISFTIETYCGCGDTNNLGVPKVRNAAKMQIKGTIS